jgi:ATP-dependent helicase HrpA
VQISYPPDLPVSQLHDEIVEAIRANQVVIVAGATGSGKTTQLPKMCLELGQKSIAHTQPRRIAARAVAERISEELGVELGGLVGYQVRFTDKASAETRVKVMTDGILLAALQGDRTLSQYDTIIIDEAHERSLNIDFLLGYLKQLLPKRPDLKVIITSATIDPGSFSRHFGDAPIIEVSGRSYPIEVRYRPVASEKSDDADPDVETTAADYLDGVTLALAELEEEAVGDTLVFLSGESEIRDAQDAIEGHIKGGLLAKGTEVLPLYGRLSAADQHRVFETSKVAGLKRRVILATNVAETSLTIPNIKYVIDAGTARISRYSHRAKVQRLPIEAISQASANQRAGRAGRLGPGIVIRLYSEEDFAGRPEFTDPEILRTNLASVILQAAQLGLGDLLEFPFLQPPDPRAVKDGLGLLAELGAISHHDAAGIKLSQVGRTLARLPMEPRFARMLVESKNHGLTREVMIIVAGLTIQDPRERPLEKRPQADQMHARFADPSSDFLSLLNLWNYLEDKQRELSSSAFRRLCRSEYLNFLRVREWQDLIRQLRTMTKPLGLHLNEPKVDPDGIHKSLLAGLLSQIGIKQVSDKKPSTVPAKGKADEVTKPRTNAEYLGSNQKKFVIFPGSSLAKKPPVALMSSELVETSRLFARMNAAIDPAWAEKLAGELCKRTFSEPHWEKTQGAVVAYERVTLYGVPIVTNRRMQFSRINAEYSRELFIRHALVMGEWDSKQAFDHTNRALLKELEALADRARKPQMAADEEDVFRFYDARVPADVFSTRSFEGWWKAAKHATPDLLTMTRADLLGDQEKQADEAQHPSEISVAGQEFRLRYRFDPGATDDGVTVDVPLAVLSTLTPDGFDWLVPGLRAELVTELIRSLPKNLRRNVVPAADWAAKALAVLPDEPTGNLQATLAKTLQQLSGTKFEVGDFDVSKLTTAMRMTYRVVDARGKTLGMATDLASLQARFTTDARSAVAAVVESASVATAAEAAIERSAIMRWDFAELQSRHETKLGNNVVRAFAALVAPKGSLGQAVSGSGAKGWAGVSLQLFATEAEQLYQHWRGVVALVCAEIASPAKYVEEHLTSQEKLAIASLPYPNFAAFIDDLIAAVAERAVRAENPSGLIFSQAQFDRVRAAAAANLIDICFNTAALVAKIAVLAREANKAISECKTFELLSILTAEKNHLAELLVPNFVSRTGLDRLPRLAIYLQAVRARIERLQVDSTRDRVAAADLDQALALYNFAGGVLPLPADLSQLPAASKPELLERIVTARWLLEELRVSLFAQPLGTSETVSVQRIKKALS